MKLKIAFQDIYSDWSSHCYGCGRLNEHGLQIKSYWDETGQGTICHFTPSPFHTAAPGFVYGGLIASLIDCHSTGSAAAAAYRAEGRELGAGPEIRFVTASLHVDFIKPTPMGEELEIRGKIEEIKGRKVIVSTTLSARGEICAKGRVVAVHAPDSMKE